MRANEIITEKWSQKYKSSINCSHPKGFSQRAHCAGKKKHNESTEMEMVCEDCGMCQTHGNLNEIKKGAKDANGYTRCWPGKHAEGTKKGRNGGQVRNCVPNESTELNEYIVRSGDDIMSVMSLNLFADLLGQGNLSDYDEEFANSPEWQAVVSEWAPKAEYLQREIAKYQSTGRKLRDAEADALDATAYDGSDAYENADMAAKYLPKVYNKQASAIVRLLKDGYANPASGMHEDSGRVTSDGPIKLPTSPTVEPNSDYWTTEWPKEVRRKKQELLKDFSQNAKLVEIEWAFKHKAFMSKEQILDYLDQTVEDPDLTPLEYMHNNGYSTDSMLKGMLKWLFGLGLSKADIFGIIKSARRGNTDVSPAMISRVARQALRTEMSEGNSDFKRAVDDKGRTQQEWMDLVKAKFPGARIVQAKMIDGPVVAYLPDGKKIGWRKVDQELSEEFDLIESIIEDIAEHNGVDAEVIWEDLESLDDDELYVFATTTTIMETEAWQKANNRDKTDGMSKKAVKTYRREHPGSKLQTAVTTKPSKLKKGSKASKRRKSYCSRSRGQMKMHNISCAKTPDKAICKARRRWNC
jgi:hypothetical protein